ncbi:hypothetical protein CR513_35726, partial [Mucuna pruriens]
MSKCKIPPFLGNCKPEVYADWELKVEKILSCFNLHGQRVVRLIILEFGDYALVALKRLMRNRFVPPSYTNDLHNKLQRLYQGSKSLEEKSDETTLAWREIQDVVELQHYRTLDELIHQAIRVEMKIRRRSASRKTYIGISGWKGKEREGKG